MGEIILDIKEHYATFKQEKDGLSPWDYPVYKLVWPKAVVLDIGAGSGYFSAVLAQKLSCAVSCVDYSVPNIYQIKERGLNAYRVDIELETLPFGDNTFDQVLFIEVVEHLFDPNNILKEIYRVLKPAGELILSTPNTVNIERRLRYAIWGEVPPMNDVTVTNGEHIRLYNSANICRLLVKHGFRQLRNHSWFLVPRLNRYWHPPLLKDLFTQHVLMVASK